MLSHPQRPRKPSPITSPGRRVFVEDSEVRASRRLQGHAPEFGFLPSQQRKTQARGAIAMTSQSQQTEGLGSPPVIYWPTTARSPASFNGDAFEDVEDWIQQYERVACYNGWTEEQCRRNLYFSLDHAARTWFENHEKGLTSWALCKDGLLRAFANQHRRQRAEDLLKARIQGPNERVVSFVEDVLRLIARADPQATEETKVRALMRGVKSEIFGGLVRNPPTTVDAFVADATNIEQMLCARSDHYHRLATAPANISAVTSTPHGVDAFDKGAIREIIREILQEELRKFFPTSDTSERPASVSVAQVIREEVQRALLPETPLNTAIESPVMTYAMAARQPRLSVTREPAGAPRRDATMPSYYQSRRSSPPVPRKTDVWRTADNRPLCFHCGEADHVYRRCPYRELGLRGFHPSAPCPRLGEQPREIEEYLRRTPPPVSVAARGPRSPSPHRPLSPLRRSRRESLSPLPRREN